MLIKTKALVLKIRSLGEEDRMLVLLSKEFGRMEVRAKRVKSVRSKLFAATQPFCYSEFWIFRGKQYDTVNTADLIESFYGLRLDVTALSLASYCCDLVREISPHEEEAWDCLRLLLNTLSYLQQGQHPRVLLKAIFELRLLALSGWMPDLSGCERCGRSQGGVMRLHLLAGVLRCEGCEPSSSSVSDRAGAVYPLGASCLEAMRHILAAPDHKLFAFSLGEKSRRCLSVVCERAISLQVDRPLSSLALYHQFEPM